MLALFSKEANQEIENFLYSRNNYISPDGSETLEIADKIVDFVCKSMTRAKESK